MNIRKYENVHILLWLLKDLCWVCLWKTGGMIMIVPTVLMAFFITWKTRFDRTELLHNLAVCCWILANSVWMTGEFFYDDALRPAVAVLFFLGLLCVGYYYTGMYILKPKAVKMKAEPVETTETLQKNL